jgi:glycosyltransferase involved in cell wall biosynthesis
MKILHVMAYPPDHMGGYSLYCRNLMAHLTSQGIECEVLTSYYNRVSKKRECIDLNDIKVYSNRYWGNLFGLNPLFNILPFLKRNYENYDIIHAHSYIFFSTIQSAFFRKIRKFPLVLQLHGGIQTDAFYPSSLFEKLQLLFKKIIFDPIIGRITLKAPDALVSVSYLDLQTVLKSFKITRDNNFWIPNAVDISKFKLLKGIERKYITFVGRLSYIKGFDIFLKIAEKIHKKKQDIEFIIVGDGPLLNLLREYKSKIPIKYYQRVPYEKMIQVYNKSKILLITSRYEGIPATMLEAMACGTVVVASKAGGVPEVIRNEKYGFMFDLNDLESAAELCVDLIEHQNKYSIDSRVIRDYINKGFSWETITKKMITVYEKLIL